MSRYEALHYRGDVEEAASNGELLGYDEGGRPYAVIDAEYQPESDTTTVFLQYATPEQIQAAMKVRSAIERNDARRRMRSLFLGEPS